MEQPLASKGLRLVTLALSITLILILSTIAYSAYEDLAYVFEGLGSGEGMPQFSVNGTHLALSNLVLANRGVYPLHIELSSQVTIGGVDLGSASTGKIIIPPKTQKEINLTLPLDLTRVYSDYSLLKTMLFNGTMASFRMVVGFGLQPFVVASFGGGFNSSIGAALDDLAFRLQSLEPMNDTHVKADVEMEFTNRSPLMINGVLHAALPSARQRNLLYASDPLEVSAPPNQHYLGHLTFQLPEEEMKSGALYILNLVFETVGYKYEWNAAFRV